MYCLYSYREIVGQVYRQVQTIKHTCLTPTLNAATTLYSSSGFVSCTRYMTMSIGIEEYK